MDPHDLDLGPLAHVEHHRDGDRSTLVFVRQLSHPPERVWAALTDPEQLAAWAPFEPDRSLVTPGPATFRMRDGDKVVEYPANVRHAVSPHLLEYTWGDDLLRWELQPHDQGTTLTLRHTVESPDWLPRTAAGWHLCLVVADRLLAGSPIRPIVGAGAKNHGWEALHGAYAARLGVKGTGWPAELPPDR